MNEHDEVRRLLPLAAAGAISPANSKMINDHILHCESCRLIGADFLALENALRGLPTPQPRAEIVARVHQMAAEKLAERQARGREAAFLAPLVAAGWVAALATWPLVQGAGRWVLDELYSRGAGIGTALAVYSTLGLFLASIAAIAVSRRAGAFGRMK